MKKVAIYVRVSTQDQAEEGYSIDEQIDKLTKFCEIKNWHVADVYTDPGFTGSNIQRPALQRLIKDVQHRRVNLVLVYKLDRLSRSQKDTLYLIEDVFGKHHADFVSLNENFDTSTPFGKAMIGILSVFAQLEREQITERMKMGKTGRAKTGKAMSWVRPPFGYTYQDGNYCIDELQASVVKQIFKDYLAGISITKLRDQLNEEGHIGKDIPWSYRTLRQTLDNPVYTGFINYKGQTYPGNHTAVISQEMYDKVQIELNIRQKEAYAKNNNSRPFQGKYLLSGILRCGYCGAPLGIVLGNKRKDGSRYKKYQCVNKYPNHTTTTIYNNGDICQSGRYKMEELENYVLDEIEKLQLDPAVILTLSRETVEEDPSDMYEKRISTIEKQLAKLSDLYMNDLLSLEDMQLKAKKLQDERKVLTDKIEMYELREETAKKNKAIAFLKDARVSIKEETEENQKIIVNKLVQKVDVTADQMNIRWNF